MKKLIEENIRTKVALGIKLTAEERSLYLLRIATNKELLDYLRREKENKYEQK